MRHFYQNSVPWLRKRLKTSFSKCWGERRETLTGANWLTSFIETPDGSVGEQLQSSSWRGLLPQGYGDKHITLYDIRAELSCRYKDLRTAYRSPNTEEIFNMLTKETPETFYIGKFCVCFLAGGGYVGVRGCVYCTHSNQATVPAEWGRFVL